ncbi:MAG: HlyD family efflux transporter periplasmic adaptor subunit [Clostridia bacterium]|nr:HlyD family efflux transporter periplasmic adaptor subunit [Clostridia bacterium]
METSFEQQLKRKKRRTIIKSVIALVVVAVLVVFGIQGYRYLQKLNSESEEETSLLSYRVQSATEGNITTTLSSSGTLTAILTETVTNTYSGTVEAVYYAAGDTVEEGEVLFVLSDEAIKEQRETLMSELDTLSTQMNSTREYSTSLYLTASLAGVVKDIKVEAGSDLSEVMDEYGYLCLISTDGMMQLSLETDALSLYETVTVTVGETSVEGSVTAVSDGVFTIKIEDNSFEIGTEAEVTDADGNAVGSGTLALVNYIRVTGEEGVVDSLAVSENSSVSRGGRILTLTDYPKQSRYKELEAQRDEILEQLADLEGANAITAPFDGKILSCDIEEGDELVAGTELAIVQSTDGYTVSLSVDELDIASLATGQSVEISLDAIEGTFSGVVSNISYYSSSSGSVVRYTTTVTVEDIEGALAGMSATCSIATADSGTGILVPVDAVQSLNGEDVVYLAPSGAVLGDSYNETEIDLTTLTAVAVETGMSDGSYIMVTGDIADGDLIIVPVLTTTSTYTASDETTMFNMGGMGGMGGMSGFGGEMPSIGGDSSSFDFGTMPDIGGGQAGGRGEG